MSRCAMTRTGAGMRAVYRRGGWVRRARAESHSAELRAGAPRRDGAPGKARPAHPEMAAYGAGISGCSLSGWRGAQRRRALTYFAAPAWKLTPHRTRNMTRMLVLALVRLIATAAAAQVPHAHRHGFSDAERWARVFDDPARDAWKKPQQVIEALRLPADAPLADLGAGTGYFTVRLARAAGRARLCGTHFARRPAPRESARCGRLGT